MVVQVFAMTSPPIRVRVVKIRESHLSHLTISDMIVQASPPQTRQMPSNANSLTHATRTKAAMLRSITELATVLQPPVIATPKPLERNSHTGNPLVPLDSRRIQ